MRSSPKPSDGHGLRDSTQRVALVKVLRQLLALGSDSFRRRVRHELLVREHPLGALDLVADALALCLCATRPGFILGRADDRLEDAGRVAHQLDANAAASVDPRGRLSVLDLAEVTVVPLGFEP